MAVLPVIFYHAGFPLFSAGFVGVDIFFVISGYLITGLISSDLELGKFTFAEFYERRARRILPALFLVMLCTIPFAWMWMLPAEFQEFGQSIVAVSLFASNFLFAHQSGYFAAAAELKPLLHTWSLAVEEQYYVVFPVFLLLAWRLGRRSLFCIIAAIAIASLLFGAWDGRHHPAANFYLTPTRAWELLLGALCTLWEGQRGVRRNNWLSLIGVGMIVAAIFTYGVSTPFPSFFALVPTVGAALVLMFGRDTTIVAKVFSKPPLVGMGLISYSAYLWHQPLFAFARLLLLPRPSPDVMLSLAIVSIMLAWLSWRFVETPFRRRSGLFAGRTLVFSLSAAFIVLFVVGGSAAYVLKGMPGRLPAKVQQIANAAQPVGYVCVGTKTDAEFSSCTIGALGSRPTVALVGDSHAGRYAYALDGELSRRHAAWRLVFGDWCAPLMDFYTTDMVKNGLLCRQNMSPALQRIAADPTIKTVVLAAEWSNYKTGFRYGSDISTYSFGASAKRDVGHNPEQVSRALTYTIDMFRRTGKQVVLVLPTPEYEFSVPEAMARQYAVGGAYSALALPLERYRARNRAVLLIFATLPKDVSVIDPKPGLCDARNCYPYSPTGAPLYSDASHLTKAGLASVPTLFRGLLN